METLRSKGSSDELAQNTTSHKTPSKSGVPPKRLSTNALRTSYSTPTATTKQNTASASKSTRGSAFSKPPTRPPATSLARRSANELPPPTFESRGHRQRNSTSSVESFTKGEPSASDENGKPSSGTPKSPTKSGAALKARRSTLGTGSNKEPKNHSVRDGTKSLSKSASRPSLSGATSLADRTALRSGRPQVSSAKPIPSSLAPAKKRLSTIPDSPSPAQNTENASDEPFIASSNPSDQIDRTHQNGSPDQAKDRELNHQREVIESLQKKLLQLHESKDQELESVKIDLSQAHEAIVLKFRQECEETIERHREDATAKLKNAEDFYNALLNEQQGNKETQLRELQATVTSLHETNAELRRSFNDLQLTKIKEFESRLASSAEEIEELKSSEAEVGREADLVREQMAILEAERDQAQESKSAMDIALSRTLDEVMSLKMALETLDKEGKDAALQHQVQLTQAKEEVAATARTLKENSRQSEVSTTDHLAELQDLRNSHQTTIEEHAKKSQSDLAELQSKYDTLLKETEGAAKHRYDDIEALKSEKARLITSKNLELEEIKISHNRELDALKERILFYESQSRSDQEARKKLEEDMASVQQRQKTECRLMREECDAAISQKVQEAERLLRDNLKAQLDSNSELSAQHQDSQATAKRLTNVICEIEKKSNGNSPSTKNRAAQAGVHVVGEDLGSRTQAHMAGMQEQIRQMDRLNEEMLAEQQSFYLKLVKVEELPLPVSRSSSSSGRASRAAGQPLQEAELSDSIVSHEYDESDESEL
ncbi:MAG: hypothetical protein Q9214_004678 [Letrouitia sp. 1 TL-2023]